MKLDVGKIDCLRPVVVCIPMIFSLLFYSISFSLIQKDKLERVYFERESYSKDVWMIIFYLTWSIEYQCLMLYALCSCWIYIYVIEIEIIHRFFFCFICLTEPVHFRFEFIFDCALLLYVIMNNGYYECQKFVTIFSWWISYACVSDS